MLLNIGLIVLGFLCLIKGGDWLVDGAVAIAKKAKLSPMVIGLTIVGFGTSTPELLVSLQAALIGNSGIAIGNVVGSNIANIALILGVTGLITACHTNRQTLRVDMPFMMLSCVLLVVVAMTGTIGRLAGIIGFLLLITFVSWQIWNSRKENASPEVDSISDNEKVMPVWKALLLVVVSIALLTYGADWLIQGATGFAKSIGVSDRIIGLTIIAVGTSLPELFASVMSARKGETDMAIGNVIGSITFNILSVIGLSAAICPITNSNQGFLFDYLLMIALGALLWLFLFTKRTLERWEGGVFVAIYLLYLIRTILC